MSSRPTAPAPLVDVDLDECLTDLTGIDPDLDQILTSLRRLATKRHDLEGMPTLLTALAGGASDNPDLLQALALTIRSLGDPASNPALRDLTPRRAQQVRKHTRLWTDYDTGFAPRTLISEAAGWADPSCPTPDDH